MVSTSNPYPPVCVVESSPMTRETGAAQWVAPLVALGLAGLIALYLFRSTVSSMVSVWYGSRTYSYGFVTLPISAFLIGRRRDELKRVQPTTSMFGLALFFVCAMVWVAGNVADVQVVQHVALIGLIDALIWALLGNSVVKILRFSLLFLFLAVPAGDSLVAPLQHLTAAFTVNALRLSGIPAVLDGLVLSTPSGNWEVAQACSGIRYLSASRVIGVLFAGVAYRSWKRRIAFICASIAIPVAANAIRAYGIVVLGYLSNNRLATGVDHILYGWIFFSLTTVLLISLGVRWAEPEINRVSSREISQVQVGQGDGFGQLVATALTVILIGVSATSLAERVWARPAPSGTASNFLLLPRGWVEMDDLDPEWAPNPTTIQTQTAKTFVSGTQRVSVYEGVYPGVRRGVELLTAFNATGSAGSWELVNSHERKAIIGGRRVVVLENTIARGVEHRLVWVWYSTGDKLTSSPYQLKALQAGNRLLGHPQPTALFAVSVPVGADPSEAVQALSQFLE
jgi:exosortase A